MGHGSPLCDQCGKPAIQVYDGHPLCVEHYSTAIHAMDTVLRHKAALSNMLAGEIDQVFEGIVGPSPRYVVPPSTLHTGNMTHNNIRIDRSQVGVLNTGQIQKLDFVMGQMRTQGQEAFASALQQFTQAVVDAQEVEPESKNEILEDLAFLSEQATLPVEQRQRSVGRAVITGLGQLVTNAGSLASVWTALEPYLSGLFASGGAG